MPRPVRVAGRFRSYGGGAAVASFLLHAADKLSKQRGGGIAARPVFLDVDLRDRAKPTGLWSGSDDTRSLRLRRTFVPEVDHWSLQAFLQRSRRDDRGRYGRPAACLRFG
jgi:hypothetical protein